MSNVNAPWACDGKSDFPCHRKIRHVAHSAYVFEDTVLHMSFQNRWAAKIQETHGEA